MPLKLAEHSFKFLWRKLKGVLFHDSYIETTASLSRTLLPNYLEMIQKSKEREYL